MALCAREGYEKDQGRDVRLFLDDNQAKERLGGMDMGLRLLDLCEELWVFGDHYGSGMQRKSRT